MNLHDHQINDLNKAIDISHGPAGPGGAPLNYALRTLTGPNETGAKLVVENLLTFQSGDPAEKITGISNEALLVVLINRLQGFQKGPFACRENAIALTELESALLWLQKRTVERMARKVEGRTVL